MTVYVCSLSSTQDFFFLGGRVLRNEGTLEKGLLRFLNYILGHELDSLERIPLDLVFFFFFFEL